MLGKDLYERIAKLGEHWANVGDRLNKAVTAYNEAVGSLEARVLPAASANCAPPATRARSKPSNRSPPKRAR
ncbi:DNA recombination protein RmuC [Mizugakiibacter sediminis]|uniref:DNA recombination protein RmuC n=1 Tax=Mizugakiibacter sediminis TaxID=1475481 RepID=A0A0K8QNP2_9GAMM|nr:DNA recombination protein RmuC [Mizugakiibacter sediminis]